jgi:predicted acylesterase/phospholipase RssA
MATEPDGGLGLTLSGGGFRATLYHLGVVRFLYDAGALSRVRRICSVSGGSILAAHLVLNWGRYTGKADDFDAAAQELLDLVRSDLRGRVVRRWLFGLLTCLRWALGTALTRIRLLEREYQRLYGRKQLKDLKAGPELYLLATSMTTGDLCCFTPDGLAIDSGGGGRTFRQPQLPLALAVAASSAFPPFFPPVPVTRELLHRAEGEFSHDHYLADGGVFDNLGIHKMQRLQGAKPLPLSHVLVSDVQGPFDWALNSRYSLLPKRATRASDILMKRVSDLEYEQIQRAGGCTYVRCCLQDEVPDDPMPSALQCDSRTIRTDLDPFSPVEIEVLVRRGYTTARRAWQGNKELAAAASPPTGRPWAPPAPAGIADAVDNGTADLGPSKKLRLRLFSPRDWASWASLLVVSALVAVLPARYLWGLYKLQQQQASLAQERRDQEKRQAEEHEALERKEADVRANLEAQYDLQQERLLQLILTERFGKTAKEQAASTQGSGAKDRQPAQPGALLKTDIDVLAICCVVVTDRSKRCFLTSNTSFVTRGDMTGERVYLASADGKDKGPAVGVIQKVGPLTFSGEEAVGNLVDPPVSPPGIDPPVSDPKIEKASPHTSTGSNLVDPPVSPPGIDPPVSDPKIEKASPHTSTGTNTGGALVLTDPLLVTAKWPHGPPIRGTAKPSAGQSVRMLVGTKALSGVVTEGEKPDGVSMDMLGDGRLARFPGAFVIQLPHRADLGSIKGGAPVITESNDLIGMTYARNDAKNQVVAISIASLFEGLGVKGLAKD